MKPKLLFISHSSPSPPTDGKRQRTLALLLAALNQFDVDFIALDGHQGNINSFIPEAYKETFQFISVPVITEAKWKKKLGISFSPTSKIKNALKDILETNGYDRVFCRYAISAKDLPKDCHYILDVDDDYEELMRTKILKQLDFFKKLRLLQIYYFNFPFYRRVLSRADQLIWVKSESSRKDGRVLCNLPFQILFSGEPALVAPYSKDILYIGKLSYEPNSEGLKWFLENVWPKLRANRPGIKLSVVSSVRPSLELEKLILDSEEVSLHVNVADLSNFYYQHRLAIVPIFFGGGSNIKLSESLVMGRRVVASAFGARGFSKWVETGLVSVANSSEEWVEHIIQAIGEPWSGEEWIEVRRHFSLQSWNNEFLRIVYES